MTETKKPTIADLETIMASDDHEITINPDGSITTTPKPKPEIADVLAFARQQPTNY